MARYVGNLMEKCIRIYYLRVPCIYILYMIAQPNPHADEPEPPCHPGHASPYLNQGNVMRHTAWHLPFTESKTYRSPIFAKIVHRRF
jgi:hypothetical protein